MKDLKEYFNLLLDFPFHPENVYQKLKLEYDLEKVNICFFIVLGSIFLFFNIISRQETFIHYYEVFKENFDSSNFLITNYLLNSKIFTLLITAPISFILSTFTLWIFSKILIKEVKFKHIVIFEGLSSFVYMFSYVLSNPIITFIIVIGKFVYLYKGYRIFYNTSILRFISIFLLQFILNLIFIILLIIMFLLLVALIL